MLSSNSISTSGKFVSLFEKDISSYTNAKYVVACNSGSEASVALRVAGVKKNDEVIVPTLTFVATVNSILYNQLINFMDSDDYFNIDINKTIEFLEKGKVYDTV